jgi:hypothetical protein
VVSFTPLPLYRGERATGVLWIGSWVDPSAGLDEEKGKIFTPPELEVRTLGQPVVIPITVIGCKARSKETTKIVL